MRGGGWMPAATRCTWHRSTLHTLHSDCAAQGMRGTANVNEHARRSHRGAAADEGCEAAAAAAARLRHDHVWLQLPERLLVHSVQAGSCRQGISHLFVDVLRVGERRLGGGQHWQAAQAVRVVALVAASHELWRGIGRALCCHEAHDFGGAGQQADDPKPHRGVSCGLLRR